MWYECPSPESIRFRMFALVTEPDHETDLSSNDQLNVMSQVMNTENLQFILRLGITWSIVQPICTLPCVNTALSEMWNCYSTR